MSSERERRLTALEIASQTHSGDDAENVVDAAEKYYKFLAPTDGD